jgi:hypothetical protein
MIAADVHPATFFHVAPAALARDETSKSVRWVSLQIHLNVQQVILSTETNKLFEMNSDRRAAI